MSSGAPTASSFTGGNPASTSTTTTASAGNAYNANSNNKTNNSNGFTVYHFASFSAMEVTVTMIPRFTMPRVSTAFGGRYGPFTPNYPVEVPLWLALHIRQTDTCTITPPSFLAVTYLRDVAEREKANDATFEALPFYFFEIVKQLCENSAAVEDIPHVSEVVRLVAEVKAIRRRKLQRSMAVFEAEGSPVFIPGIKLTHIVHHELEYLRVSFAVVLRQAAEMHRRREHRVGPAIDNYTPTTTARGSGGAPSLFSATHTSEHSGVGMGIDMESSGMGTPSMTTGAAITAQRSAEPMTTEGRRRRRRTATSAMMTEQEEEEEQSLFSQTPTGATGTSVSSITDTTETVTNATDDVLSPPVKKRRTLRQT